MPAVKAPIAVPEPPTSPAATPVKPTCFVEDQEDGSMLVTFAITPSQATRFRREACGRPVNEFLWETRGLKHFEYQRIG